MSAARASSLLVGHDSHPLRSFAALNAFLQPSVLHEEDTPTAQTVPLIACEAMKKSTTRSPTLSTPQHCMLKTNMHRGTHHLHHQPAFIFSSSSIPAIYLRQQGQNQKLDTVAGNLLCRLPRGVVRRCQVVPGRSQCRSSKEYPTKRPASRYQIAVSVGFTTYFTSGRPAVKRRVTRSPMSRYLSTQTAGADREKPDLMALPTPAADVETDSAGERPQSAGSC